MTIKDFISNVDETESSPTENLGQVMFGERIRPSPYKLKFGEDRQCKQVCTKKYTGPDYTTYLPYVRQHVLHSVCNIHKYR